MNGGCSAARILRGELVIGQINVLVEVLAGDTHRIDDDRVILFQLRIHFRTEQIVDLRTKRLRLKLLDRVDRGVILHLQIVVAAAGNLVAEQEGNVAAVVGRDGHGHGFVQTVFCEIGGIFLHNGACRDGICTRGEHTQICGILRQILIALKDERRRLLFRLFAGRIVGVGDGFPFAVCRDFAAVRALNLHAADRIGVFIFPEQRHVLVGILGAVFAGVFRQLQCGKTAAENRQHAAAGDDPLERFVHRFFLLT